MDTHDISSPVHWPRDSPSAMQAKAPSPIVNPLLPTFAQRHWKVGDRPQTPRGKLALIKDDRQAVAQAGMKSTISLGRSTVLRLVVLAYAVLAADDMYTCISNEENVDVADVRRNNIGKGGRHPELAATSTLQCLRGHRLGSCYRVCKVAVRRAIPSKIRAEDEETNQGMPCVMAMEAKRECRHGAGASEISEQDEV